MIQDSLFLQIRLKHFRKYLLKSKEEEVIEKPHEEMREVQEVFRTYGLNDSESTLVVNALATRPKEWVDFMMRFELGLEQPDPRRALNSALTIGGAYVAGGLIPLLPYMLIINAREALMISVILTVTALFIFGYVKGRFTGAVPMQSALQTTLIGGLAAAAAFLIAQAIS